MITTTSNKPVKTFVVTLRFRYPAWDEKNGIPYTIEARSKLGAVTEARRRAYDDGHTVGKRVADYSFTAVEAE